MYLRINLKIFFRATRRIYECKKKKLLNKSKNIINFLSSENPRINFSQKNKKFNICLSGKPNPEMQIPKKKKIKVKKIVMLFH